MILTIFSLASMDGFLGKYWEAEKGLCLVPGVRNSRGWTSCAAFGISEIAVVIQREIVLLKKIFRWKLLPTLLSFTKADLSSIVTVTIKFRNQDKKLLLIFQGVFTVEN